MARRNGTGTIKPCLDCGRPIRPNNWKAKDHPGTLAHAGNGVCSSCRTKKDRAENKAKQDHGPVLPDIETNRRNLNNFLQRIHADRQRLEQRKKIRMVIR